MGQQLGRSLARKARPVIFPGIIPVGGVEYLLPGTDQEAFTRREKKRLPVPAEDSLSRDDVVQQVVVAHPRAPAVQRAAFLKARVINHQPQSARRLRLEGTLDFPFHFDFPRFRSHDFPAKSRARFSVSP